MRGENLHFLKTIFSSFSPCIYILSCRNKYSTMFTSPFWYSLLREREREPFSLHAYCLPRRKLHVVKLNLHEFILSRSFCWGGLALCYCLNIYTQSHIFRFHKNHNPKDDNCMERSGRMKTMSDSGVTGWIFIFISLKLFISRERGGEGQQHLLIARS